jgi:hypothetical protein
MNQDLATIFLGHLESAVELAPELSHDNAFALDF